MSAVYDLTIIGGGPAGVAAGVYAARKQLDTLLITENFGGQSINSPQIENWIGTKSISGSEFAAKLEAHLREYEGEYLDIRDGTRVTDLYKTDDHFAIESTESDHIGTQAVLSCAGAHRRKLKIDGAAEFENKGVVYCASCDGPLFAGKDVVVIGGGNAGFEAAAQLLSYVKSVTLLQHSDRFKAEDSTVEAVLEHEHMTAHLNAEPRQIKGDGFTESIVYEDLDTNELHEIPAEGVFVEIGLVPNTDFAADVVDTNEINQIIVDPKTQKASADGIWAAGDCTDGLYHQNNIAAGDGIKAVEDIYLHLRA